jgi:hypothetical protein
MPPSRNLNVIRYETENDSSKILPKIKVEAQRRFIIISMNIIYAPGYVHFQIAVKYNLFRDLWQE